MSFELINCFASIKEPFDKKGARVTTDLSIAGRFIVLIPKSKYIGVSKKMRDKKEMADDAAELFLARMH